MISVLDSIFICQDGFFICPDFVKGYSSCSGSEGSEGSEGSRAIGNLTDFLSTRTL